jgi:hypothetical protein
MSLQKLVKREGAPMLTVKIGSNDQDAVTAPPPSSLYSTKLNEVKLTFAPRRYVVYSRFNDVDYVHIREYDEMTNQKGSVSNEYPSKRGVCLSTIRLKVLRSKFDEIDDQLNLQRQNMVPNYKTHLGAGIYASVGEYKGVDLRNYFIPEDKMSPIPTKRGIFIPTSQWTRLKEKLLQLLSAYPHLADAVECFHQNQMDQNNCRECLPFGLAI